MSEVVPALMSSTSTASYIDTVEVSFPYLPKGIRSSLEESHGRRVRISPSCDKNGIVRGYRVSLDQPSQRTLRVSGALQRQHRGSLCRVDIAYDFSSHTRKWLEDHCILRWRRSGPMCYHENAINFVLQRGRTRRSSRDAMAYADKPSKITGEVDVAHFELRFLNSESVRRQGYRYADELIDLDPRKLFEKHVKLVDIDIERLKGTIIRKQLKKDRAKCRNRETSPFMDKYRASLPRRLRYLLDTHLRAQTVKDNHPSVFKRVKPISIDVLGLPTKLDWVTEKSTKILKRGWTCEVDM